MATGHRVINSWRDFTSQPAEFTAHLSAIPTVAFGGSAPNRYMSLDGQTNDHMRKPMQIAGSDVSYVRMDVLYKTYTNLTSTPGTGQLFWTAANAENISGTSSFVGELYVSDLSPALSRVTRRTGVTSASNGSASSVLNGNVAPTLSTSTLYWKRFERVGTSTSRTYNSAYYTDSSFSLGSLVSGSNSTTGALSDAGTDQEDNHFIIATGRLTEIYAVILYKINSPNITADPSNTTGVVGGTAQFVATAVGGDYGTTPGVTTNIDYQWQVNDGGGWVNVSTGSGGTTDTYTTPTLTLSEDGYLYRCVFTDDGNSETHTSGQAELTVLATLGPVPASATSANDTTGGDTRIDVTFTNVGTGLVLDDNDPAKWSAEKQNPAGGTVPLTITAVVLSGDDIQLTVTERILKNDTAILVSLLASDAISNDVDNGDPFDDQPVTNASARDFAVSLTSPFNEIACFKDYGYWFARVGAPREGSHAASLTLTMTPPGSMGTLALASTSSPGTGTLGTTNVVAPGVSHDLSGSATATYVLTDPYGNTRVQTAPVYVCDRAVQFDNRADIVVGGTSTAVNFTADGFINNFYSKYGDVADTLRYIYSTITHLNGEYGQSGQTTAAWVPNSANGFPSILLAGAVKRGCRVLIYCNSYLNDAIGANVWATHLKANTILTYQFFADNFEEFLSCEMSGRVDQTATGTFNITSATTTTVTVTGASGTIDATCAGKWCVVNRSVESAISYRVISSVDDLGGGSFRFNLDTTDYTLGDGTVIEGELPEVPTGTGFVTPTTYYDRADSYNVGRLELCEGGADEINGTSGTVPRPIESGIIEYGRDWTKASDKLHLVSSMNGSGFHVDLLRRIGLQAVLAINAAVVLSSVVDTINVLEELQIDLAMTGPPLGNDYFPDDFRTDGDWTIDADTTGGASVDTDGTLTAGPNAGSVTVLFTSAHTPYGDVSPMTDTITITVENPSPGGEGASPIGLAMGLRLRPGGGRGRGRG